MKAADIHIPSVAELTRKRLCELLGLPYEEMSPEAVAVSHTAMVAHLNHVHGRPCIPGFDALLEAVSILIHATPEEMTVKQKVDGFLKAAAIERGAAGNTRAVATPGSANKPTNRSVTEAEAGKIVEPANAPTINPFQIEVTEFGDAIADAKGNL